jgi:uncharacterized Zn-finger protein
MTSRPPVPISPEALPPPEEFAVEGHRVACDGGGVLGHPLVYLEFGAHAFVDCGYCDRRFRRGVNGGAPYHDPSPRPVDHH